MKSTVIMRLFPGSKVINVPLFIKSMDISLLLREKCSNQSKKSMLKVLLNVVYIEKSGEKEII